MNRDGFVAGAHKGRSYALIDVDIRCFRGGRPQGTPYIWIDVDIVDHIAFMAGAHKGRPYALIDHDIVDRDGKTMQSLSITEDDAITA